MSINIVHKAFECKAKENPNNIAVIDDYCSITYSELNSLTSKFAVAICNLLLENQSVVGVTLQPSCRQIVSMLSVFKSCNTYMPIDLTFPDERIKQMFNETLATTLIIERTQLEDVINKIEKLDLPVKKLIYIDENNDYGAYIKSEQGWLTRDLVTQLSAFSAEKKSGPNDSAYIYYTSGSTGKGKAILGNHKGVANYINWLIQEFSIDSSFNIPNLSKTTFDASLKEYWMALCSGATLYIPPLCAKSNMIELMKWLKTNNITTVQNVPSIFRLLSKACKDLGYTSSDLPNMRHIFLYGEPLYCKDIILWREQLGSDIEIINMFGTTETAILDTFHRVNHVSEQPEDILHVGRPIDHTMVIILNSNNLLCRVGEKGFIYIKSPFMTKGYLDQDLNRDSFVQNPLIKDRKDIVYKTGDIGRYLEGRVVEVLGRADRQVKVNGVRVELNEVEQALISIEGIGDVAVTSPRNSRGEVEIVCYHTGDLKSDEIRNELSLIINKELIPSFFIKMDSLPLNNNGKTDRNRLPPPRQLLSDAEVSKLNELEEKIKSFFVDITGFSNVNKITSFLDIGGNSIKIMDLISRVYREFGVNVNFREVLENSSIYKLSALVESKCKAGVKQEQVEIYSSSYRLSYGQLNFFSNHRYIEDTIVGLQEFNGEVDAGKLTDVLNMFIDTQENLRSVFSLSGKNSSRNILLNAPSRLELTRVGAISPKDYEGVVRSLCLESSKKSFDLSVWPQFEFILVESSNESCLIFVAHHILADASSIREILAGVKGRYRSLATEPSNNASNSAAHYKEFCQWQHQYLSTNSYIESHNYWKDKIASIKPFTLPRYLTKQCSNSGFASLSIFLDGDLKRKAKILARDYGTTEFCIYLTSLFISLATFTKEENIVLAIPVSLREPEHKNVLGLYSNILLLAANISIDETFDESLRKVFQDFSNVLEHKRFPLECILEEYEKKFTSTLVNMHSLEDEKLDSPIESIIKYNEEETPFGNDLSCVFLQYSNCTVFRLSYNKDLYSREVVEGFANNYMKVLESPKID
ncbi:amino acid adenylation domain-containing protein [Vibrio caribbeanicus]|uniref:AMP-dependent synthetase and ligase n=1 Tax=Vibrio caribbeanicus ATCC BAA-2122 TaxID=796620 RepID=E3BLC1_9VIBR|nr:amino acid adenylation domain-containing protein [Vibrio caribbeanicus]EFP96133.1 AMP-dependent synthetase and ligase [Vibrio caribbeanicus ATCC BAA-2122]